MKFDEGGMSDRKLKSTDVDDEDDDEVTMADGGVALDMSRRVGGPSSCHADEIGCRKRKGSSDEELQEAVAAAGDGPMDGEESTENCSAFKKQILQRYSSYTVFY